MSAHAAAPEGWRTDQNGKRFDNYGTPSAPTDPLPLAPLVAAEGVVDSGYRIGFEVVLNVKRFPNVRRVHAAAPGGAEGTDQKNNKKYFIVNVVIPAILLTLLSEITYVIPPTQCEARVALNLTLILSFTALQFVVSDTLPKSSKPTNITRLFLICYFVVA